MNPKPFNRRVFCQTGMAISALAASPSCLRASVLPGESAVHERVLLGVDYYPDQTPETLWAEDARRMAEAGVTNVRLAEFAWSLMEPSEGQFRFDWLHRAVALLDGHGIASILGTPSAAPPPWLTQKYPEVLLVNEQGVTMTPDSRRFTCPTNQTYRRLSCAIATEMANSFAKTHGVIGWQIDNEFTLAGFPRCYCRFCRAGFQQWLQRRYGSLDAINSAWGTAFWSQVYTDFTQIPVPLPSAAPPNPGLALDYDRYQSDAYAAFQNLQVDILRARCPGHFLTTNNVAGFAGALDMHTLFEKLDFACADNYPGFAAMYAGGVPDALLAPRIAFSLDAMRGMKDGKPFLVMEQQTGKAGQPFFCPQPHPGQVRLWTYQAVAHGAMGINYFRWNTENAGAEEYWHGLLNHDRSKNPAFEEVVQTIAELKKLGSGMLHAPVVAEAAVTFDADSGWAVEIQPGQRDLKYADEVTLWYGALWSGHIGLDCVGPNADLSQYRIVLLPLQYVLTATHAEKLTRFVEGGGTLVTGYRSGVKNERNQVIATPRPGLLREIAGATVVDYVPMYSGTQSVQFSGALAGPDAPCEMWYDALEPHGADVLARYAGGDHAGKAAITVNTRGKGRVYYVGAKLEPQAMGRVLRTIAASAGVRSIFDVPEGVEVAERSADGRRWMFLLNHTAAPQTVGLPAPHRDLLSGGAPVTTVALKPYGVAVLQPA